MLHLWTPNILPIQFNLLLNNDLHIQLSFNLKLNDYIIFRNE